MGHCASCEKILDAIFLPKIDPTIQPVLDKIKRYGEISIDDVKHLNDKYLENAIRDLNEGYNLSLVDVNNMSKRGSKILYNYIMSRPNTYKY